MSFQHSVFPALRSNPYIFKIYFFTHINYVNKLNFYFKLSYIAFLEYYHRPVFNVFNNFQNIQIHFLIFNIFKELLGTETSGTCFSMIH